MRVRHRVTLWVRSTAAVRRPRAKPGVMLSIVRSILRVFGSHCALAPSLPCPFSLWLRCGAVNLGTYETQDQLAGARHFSKLDYVDASRIGLWGWVRTTAHTHKRMRSVNEVTRENADRHHTLPELRRLSGRLRRKRARSRGHAQVDHVRRSRYRLALLRLHLHRYRFVHVRACAYECWRSREFMVCTQQ
jgi:hypothetical protein